MGKPVLVKVVARPSAQHFIAGVPVVTEAPDGSLHGQGSVVASADACRVRPQDCAPIMRQMLFGKA